MCGEQLRLNHVDMRPIGSPPRVRGTVPRPIQPQQVVRITPACAGNSFKLWERQPCLPDHPRVCGEQDL